MSTEFTKDELVEIYKQAFYNHFLAVDHRQMLLDLIANPDVRKELLELALEILTIDPADCNLILDNFTTYPKPTQLLSTLILSSYQDTQLQTKLFDLVESLDDEEVSEALVFCMAKSPYLNIAPILDHLYTEDKRFKARLTDLLALTPLQKFEIFIAATPELPHEALFRRVYGNDMIDALRGPSTNSSPLKESS